MKFVFRLRWLLCALLALGPSSSSLLQAQNGLVIKAIEVKFIGPPPVSEAYIAAHIRMKVGEPFNPRETDDDITNLKATGFFYNIQIAAEPFNSGVKLVYVVQGQPILTDIRFSGNKEYSDRKLQKKVTVKIGEPLDEYKLFNSAQEMQKMYEKGGYSQTKVDAKVSINEQLGRGTVTFEVREAPKVRVKDVQFVGAQAFSQKKLRGVIDTRRWWIFSWLTGSGKMKEEQFEDDKQKLKEFYWDHGYIDFEIRDIEFDYLNPNRLVIRFHITEGKQYKVGSITFKGNTKFTAEQIRRGLVDMGMPVRMRMVEGSVFTPKGLDQDVEAIQSFYGAQGYIGREDTAKIPVVPVRTANIQKGTIDLAFRVNEGEKSFIERIEIRGNTKTKDRVIRRELAVYPGETFDMVRVDISKMRLEGLQYFSKVQSGVEPTDVPESKNLVISVEEAQSGNFYFGAGFSTIDKLFGYIGMTQGNFDLFNPPYFTGGGQKLRLQATVGTELTDYEITFVEPWFFGRKLSFEMSLFHRDIQYYSSLYDQKETGGNVAWTKALFTDSFRVGLGYTLQRIELDFNDDAITTNIVVSQGPGRGRTYTVIPPAVGPLLLSQQGDYTISEPALTFSYDTRGGGLLPNRGQRSLLLGSVAGGPFGGNVDYYRLDLQTAWYFKGFAPGHVIEVGAHGGVVVPFGDTGTVPIFARYFLGGANNLRGYEYREVGPKDIYGNPIGGETFWFGTVEYSIPIIERLRVAAFYDIGNVYLRVSDFDMSRYNDDFGVGIRLNIPQIGPLRLDYAWPLHTERINESKPQFQFSVGYERPI